MRAIHLLPLLFLTLACACGGGGDKEVPSKTESVTVTPSSLSCDQNAQTLTLDVTASGAFQVFPADGVSWVTVEPAYSTASSAKVSVKVAKNDTYRDRETTITVKCGTTREKVTLSQSGGEVDIDMPEGYHLVWRDEFNEGSELKSSDWTHEVKGDHWVNNELQTYVNHTSPSGGLVTEVKDGSLQIHCFKEGGKIYSGRVYAKVKSGWQYGYIEGRIKLPKGKGTWPAFWMMPVNYTGWPDSGEIDIMEEVGYHPNYVSSSLHANSHVHSNGTQVTHEMYCAGAEDDFHVYAIEWTHDNITTFVDGKVQLSYDNRGLGHDDWPYDAPFYVILNLAWGGDWGGAQGVDENALPVTMLVDYVRVFQKD